MSDQKDGKLAEYEKRAKSAELRLEVSAYQLHQLRTDSFSGGNGTS